MKSPLRILGSVWLALLVAIIGVSCAKDKIHSLDKLYVAALNYVRVEADFCASEPPVAKQKIKYLFIVDGSASNQPSIPLSPGDVSNTDSSGNRRFGPMRQFVQDLTVDPNQPSYFAMLRFNDNAYLPSGAVNGFDPNLNNFINVIGREWVGIGTPLMTQPNDRGFTNYVSALSMTRDLIRTDAQSEASTVQNPVVTSLYKVIFVSDGVPTIASGAGTYTQTFDVDILPQIKQIQALKNDPVLGPYINDIVLNTAYYFTDTQVPAAAALLEQMADAGNGQFMKFGAGENILYGAFAPPSRRVHQQLADIFLDNENALWWDNGQFEVDSDGDGLPAEVEDQYGSDGRLVDSDGNGVRDGIEYRLSGSPCQDAKCAVAGRNPFSVCDGLNPTRDSQGNVTFPDTDKDGLNDCEEYLLRSDRTKWDTNGDFIPDGIALRAGVPFLAGVDGSYVQPQGDGLWNYDKLKMGLPIQIPRDKVLDFRTRVTTLTKVDTILDGERYCYHVKIDPVAVLGPNNNLKLYVIENASMIDDKPSLRVGAKRVEPGTSKVTFSDADLQ